MAKMGVVVLASIVTISLATSYLFSGSPGAYGFVMQAAGSVFMVAFLVCLLKGFVFGFDSIISTVSLRRVLGIDAIIILIVFVISQVNACAASLLAA